MILFRPLSHHPAFLPLAGAIAALVALIVLPLALSVGRAPAPNAQVALAPAAVQAEPVALALGEQKIDRVQLARDGATADAVLVRVDGTPVTLRLVDATRIIVPLNGHKTVASSVDLRPGQRAEITLAPGEQLANGATIARLTVQGTGDDVNTSA